MTKSRPSPSAAPPASARPYTALAPIYDRIMAHVDYNRWATYLVSLSSTYADPPRSVLEIGCGTGNLTVRLTKAFKCRYLATDISEEMLDVARRKLNRPAHKRVSFEVVDFRRLDLAERFDLIVLAYDGINYLLHDEEVIELLKGSFNLLNPGGLFLFDQSTPANSINNLAYFDDRWDSEEAAYVRTSRYDVERHLHQTRFEIRNGSDQTTEEHFQRAYGLEEMELILKLSSFRIESCLDAFSVMPATGESERVQWVLSKPHSSD